jgi:hemerythrin-like domain-containing protein
MAPELKPLPDKHFSDGFLQATRDFCTLSRQHVNRENMEFLPLATSSLSQLDLDEIGASMAARRGVRK